MKTTILLLLLILLISCSKDCDLNSNTNGSCISLVQESPYFTSCKDLNSSLYNYYCDIFNIGKFQIDEKSKEFIPQYCEDIGNIVVYQNNMNQKIYFEVIYKNYSLNTAIASSTHPCTSDSTKFEGYCYGNEVISFSMKAKNSDFIILFSLRTELDYSDPSSSKIGDFLQINRKRSQNSYYGEFNAIINQRTLDTNKLYNQENYDSVNINNSTYYNVLSNNNMWSPNTIYKYYYNKEIGLVGFRDTLGVIWSIIK